MSMTIKKSIDVEDAIRSALDDYMTIYCRPLPASFTTPCILVQWVGGSSIGTASGRGEVDTFTVTLDARAEEEGDAAELIRTAVAILEDVCSKQEHGLSGASLNSLYPWGTDPVRPDLAMCSATLQVTAHRQTVTITQGGN